MLLYESLDQTITYGNAYTPEPSHNIYRQSLVKIIAFSSCHDILFSALTYCHEVMFQCWDFVWCRECQALM